MCVCVYAEDGMESVRVHLPSFPFLLLLLLLRLFRHSPDNPILFFYLSTATAFPPYLFLPPPFLLVLLLYRHAFRLPQPDMAVNFGQDRYHTDFLPWEGRLTEFFDAGRLVSASRCTPQSGGGGRGRRGVCSRMYMPACVYVCMHAWTRGEVG